MNIITENNEFDFDYLVLKLGNDIYRISYIYCKNYADAEDVVQDTFLELFNHQKPFKDYEHIKRWLMTVAVNKSKNIMNSYWYKNTKVLHEEIAYYDKDISDLYITICKLPKKYRVTVVLYYYYGYSVSEISDIMKVSESSVQTRLMRARQKLKKYLKG